MLSAQSCGDGWWLMIWRDAAVGKCLSLWLSHATGQRWHPNIQQRLYKHEQISRRKHPVAFVGPGEGIKSEVWSLVWGIGMAYLQRVVCGLKCIVETAVIIRWYVLEWIVLTQKCGESTLSIPRISQSPMLLTWKWHMWEQISFLMDSDSVQTIRHQEKEINMTTLFFFFFLDGSDDSFISAHSWVVSGLILNNETVSSNIHHYARGHCNLNFIHETGEEAQL